MIGKKTLREIRESVATACVQSGVDPAIWIEEEISKANRAKPRNKAEIETLTLILDRLRAASRQRSRGNTGSASL
jgi:hypothetical protein